MTQHKKTEIHEAWVNKTMCQRAPNARLTPK